MEPDLVEASSNWEGPRSGDTSEPDLKHSSYYDFLSSYECADDAINAAKECNSDVTRVIFELFEPPGYDPYYDGPLFFNLDLDDPDMECSLRMHIWSILQGGRTRSGSDKGLRILNSKVIYWSKEEYISADFLNETRKEELRRIDESVYEPIWREYNDWMQDYEDNCIENYILENQQKGPKIFVLMGKTGSGKTTEAKLLEKDGFRRIVTDTTRSPRPEEKDGVDYRFLSDAAFASNEADGVYAETASYVMADGKTVHYGSRAADYSDLGGVIVLTPDGVRKIRQRGIGATVIFLKASEDTLWKRLEKRGDDPAEIRRRLKADADRFVGAEDISDAVIKVDGYSETEVLDKIIDSI